jgi:hypothetical protein
VLPWPQAAAIPDGEVLIEGATITAVGPARPYAFRRAPRSSPARAERSPRDSGTATFISRASQFRGAETAAADALAGALRIRLTSYGVVHVVDTGSLLANTLALAEERDDRPGMTVDVVLLEGDPAQDVRAFARVRTMMLDGRVIYRRM